MKKVLTFLMFLMVIAMAASSCKKDKTEEPELATQEKWLLQKANFQEFDSGNLVVDSLTDSTYTAQDYLALQTENQFEWVTDGQKINGTYKIENSVLFLANQSGSLQATIVQKTASDFVFYWDETGATKRIRYTFYYTK